jgi:hypothetical protein
MTEAVFRNAMGFAADRRIQYLATDGSAMS